MIVILINVYTKIFTFLGLKTVSSVVGKQLTTEMFLNSFNPVKKPKLTEKQKEKMAKKVSNSPAFKTLIDDNIAKSDGNTFNTGYTSIEFNTIDLH